MKIAVFPGSFDPITLGHYDIIERASALFDKIVVAIGTNTKKNYMFSLEQRKEWIEKTVSKFKNVEVETFEGLTIDFCKKKNADYILRGLRNPADFEFEKAIAHMNRHLSGGKTIETVFLLTSSGKSFISSSNVRDVIINKGDYSIFVPKSVKITKKIAK